MRNKTTGEFGLVWSGWQTPHKGDVDTILDPICERYGRATPSAEEQSARRLQLESPGDPSRTNRLSFEAKQFVGTKFAVAPKLNWSVDESVVGVEFPIYLLQAKDGGLTGGVTLGWRSDTKAFTASAFVGPVLKLIARE